MYCSLYKNIRPPMLDRAYNPLFYMYGTHTAPNVMQSTLLYMYGAGAGRLSGVD